MNFELTFHIFDANQVINSYNTWRQRPSSTFNLCRIPLKTAIWLHRLVDCGMNTSVSQCRFLCSAFKWRCFGQQTGRQNLKLARGCENRSFWTFVHPIGHKERKKPGFTKCAARALTHIVLVTAKLQQRAKQSALLPPYEVKWALFKRALLPWLRLVECSRLLLSALYTTFAKPSDLLRSFAEISCIFPSEL